MAAWNKFVGWLVAILMVAGGAGADSFPVPAELVGNVEFWKQVFSTYGRHQVVIHDTENPGRIYSILDFANEASRLPKDALRRVMNRAETAEIKRLQGILRSLENRSDRTRLSIEEMRIRSLFKNDPHPGRFARAADKKRIRAQRGVSERFKDGVRRSRRYLGRMESIFRDEGVPVELTRLPLVESSFNVRAYSKVGAAGLWQFMPGTGRKFLHIDPAVDERLDPFVATRAAARFLRRNYERLGSWPLAITAYNHGPAGMERAVRKVGSTDLGDIVRRYESRTFGFASKNFYAEFLAAVDVFENYRAHFGDIALDNELDADEVALPHYVALREVLPCTGTDLSGFKDLNPAVRPAAFSNRRWLPRGYKMRLDAGRAAAFSSCYDRLPSHVKRTSHPIMSRNHRVRRGETLSKIARRYGVSVSTLRRTNKLRSSNLIRIGQNLKIPASGAGSRPAGGAGQTRKPKHHKVRSGQTLAHIARKYGRSIESIRRANGLRDANHIRVGQRLKIPY